MRLMWFFVGCSFLFDAYRIAFEGHVPPWWLMSMAWLALGVKTIADAITGEG